MADIGNDIAFTAGKDYDNARDKTFFNLLNSGVSAGVGNEDEYNWVDGTPPAEVDELNTSGSPRSVDEYLYAPV